MINYPKMKVVKKTSLDGLQWFCIVRLDNGGVVARYKRKKAAQWQLNHFAQFPILPY